MDIDENGILDVIDLDDDGDGILDVDDKNFKIVIKIVVVVDNVIVIEG